jgi:septum formation protein
MQIILGTSSVYRISFASSWGLKFKTMSPDIREDLVLAQSNQSLKHRAESRPHELCLAIAKAKADAILVQLSSSEEEYLIVTSDQVSQFDGKIREKPTSIDQARLWMKEYQTKPIKVCTAIVVTHFPSGRQESVIDFI